MLPHYIIKGESRPNTIYIINVGYHDSMAKSSVHFILKGQSDYKDLAPVFKDIMQFCFIFDKIFDLRNTYSQFTKYNDLLEQTSLFITVITITILCTRRGHKALILIVSYCRSGYSK